MITHDEEICMGMTKDGLRIIGRDDMYSSDERGFFSYSDDEVL